MPGYELIVIVNLLIALASIGILLWAITNFIITPREERYKIPSFSEQREKQRQKQLASGELVVIEAQPGKALLHYFPLLVLFTPCLILFVYVQLIPHPACEFLFGIPLLYLLLLVGCYAIPLQVIVVSLFYVLPSSIRTLKCGYSPPLDSVWFSRTYARKRKAGGYVGLVVPVMAGVIIVMGHNLYTLFMEDIGYDAFVSRITGKCAASLPTSKAPIRKAIHGDHCTIGQNSPFLFHDEHSACRH